MIPLSTRPIHAPDADAIRDRLAEIIEDLNAETCPALRVELHLDAVELRAQLAERERMEVFTK